MMQWNVKDSEKGFVLATSLVMLLLLTMLSIAVYFSTQISQKTSASAESTTEAFYYAETAINYVTWAIIHNDAEFDGYTYPQAVKATGEFTFAEPEVRPSFDPYAVGDAEEFKINMGNPGGDDAVIGSFDGKQNHYGDIMYYDNSPLASRFYAWDSTTPPASPVFFEISKKLPRYIRLDIDAYGNITPAMPPYDAALPHHGTTIGLDIPRNGAVVWLTGGDKDKDIHLYPVDFYAATLLDFYTNPAVAGAFHNASGSLKFPADYTGKPYFFAAPEYPDYPLPCSVADYYAQVSGGNSKIVACDATTGTWLNREDYRLIAYAIGYVNGKARKMIRAVLPEVK